MHRVLSAIRVFLSFSLFEKLSFCDCYSIEIPPILCQIILCIVAYSLFVCALFITLWPFSMLALYSFFFFASFVRLLALGSFGAACSQLEKPFIEVDY